MRFEHATMLWWLLCLPLGGMILHLLFSYRQKISNKFINQELLDPKTLRCNKIREQFKAFCYLMVIALCIVAQARPQWGESLQEVKRKSLDIVIAVDVSKSMLTKDVRPTRLERTQWAIKDLVKKLNGDRIGLIAFAGEAFVMCPLTLDYNGFLMSVDDLSPVVIPRGGTSISKAIEEALRNNGASVGHYQALVIVTDGEDLEGDVLVGAKLAKEKGIKIFTVGVGTKEGDLIEVTDEKGDRQFMKDTEGNVVKSRLNESLLQSIAFETGGAYVRSSPSEFGLDFLYEKQLSLIPKRDIESTYHQQYHERAQWPLTGAFIFLLLPLITQNVLKRFMALAILVGMLVPLHVHASVSSDVNHANRLLLKGDVDAAVESYKKSYQAKSNDPVIMYNLANGYYRQGDYAKAGDLYTQVQSSQERKISHQAGYNLGNTFFRQGEELEAHDLQSAVETFEKALSQFEKTIGLDADDQDALNNQKITQEKIKLLKKKIEQQKNQEQQHKDQQKDENKDQKKENNNDSNEDQKKSNESKSQDKKDEHKDKQEQKGDHNSQEDLEKEKTDEKKLQPGQDVQKKNSEKKNGLEDKQQQKEQDPEKKQAFDTLDHYQRTEEPKGMLYLLDKKSDEKPVSKDW